MTNMDVSRVPSIRAVIALQNQLSGWLLKDALPFWDQHGIDRRSGGYFESLDLPDPCAAVVAAGDIRRGRVVGRQIYVFGIGHGLGWRSSFDTSVEHGCDYLFSRLHKGEGIFHSSVDAITHAPRGSFSLYDHAFYLFALAGLQAHGASRYPVAETARSCLQWLRTHLGKRSGGFEESLPPRQPLKSNPHMHLLEAALAWIEVTDGSAQLPWIELARDLVDLCLTRFRDEGHGGIRENFDSGWQPSPGDEGRVLEPGHQFEWAWLLLRWSGSSHCNPEVRLACTSAAHNLIDVAEHWGIDAARGIAINEIWDDLTTKDAAAKLWPQTERIKAWCAVLDGAETALDAERACRKIIAAAEGFTRYLRTDVPGLWHEVCAADGTYAFGPSKASSLYHVVGAIEVLRHSVGNQLPMPGESRVQVHQRPATVEML